MTRVLRTEPQDAPAQAPGAAQALPQAPGQPEVATKADFARLQGWAKSYVTKLGHEGRLVLDEEGRVRVHETLALIAQTTRAPERASQAVQDATGPEYRGDRARKEFYDAENARLDLEERLGKLMDSSQVLAVVSDAAVTLRTRLEGWRDILAPQLAAYAGDEARIRTYLTDEVELLLADLSHRLSKLAELAKAEG